MKIPERIKIAGYTYKIERPAEPFVSNLSACDGLHSFDTQTIKVSKSGNEAYQNTVFLHELVHGIIHVTVGLLN